jgi:hypothetical protein
MWNQPSDIELNKIPRLYATEDVPARDKVIHLHFFLASSDWYIAEFDGDDIFFGFACLNNWKDLAEWGYISFRELKQLKVKAPVSINGQRALIPLEVDMDLNWISRKAFNVSLIRECQGW